jgi:hypothetical protein
MTSKNQGNDKSSTILPTGAERGSNPSKTEQVQHGSPKIGAYRLHFDTEKVKQPLNKIEGTSITEIFSADKYEIESKWMDGKRVMWPEHGTKCPKHPSNSHRYTTAAEISKRAKDTNAIIMGRFVKLKK